MENPFQITSVTVSISFGDKEYSKGSSSFMNMTSSAPEGTGIPPNEEGYDLIIGQGLDMYMAAWKAMMASRCAGCIIKKDEFTSAITTMEKRMNAVKSYLLKE